MSHANSAKQNVALSDLIGKVATVTGASSGIGARGYQAANNRGNRVVTSLVG